jgi:cobalt-precorrin 5A hydrolase/precorrin-3B C17-methyltransferase
MTDARANLTVGAGCAREATPAELIELALDCLARHGLAPASVTLVASIAGRTGEPVVQALAARLGVPAHFFDAATLEAETPRLATPSDEVFRAVGCHGVAEGAALAGAGPAGELIVPKTASAHATIAIARVLVPDNGA